MKKIVFTIALAIGLTATTFAQNKKMQEKVEERIEQINEEITSSNKEVALTEEQIEKIKELEYNKLKELNQARKANATKEEKKEIHKKYGKLLYDILTKEQKKARKQTKDKMKS